MNILTNKALYGSVQRKYYFHIERINSAQPAAQTDGQGVKCESRNAGFFVFG